jgi:hypothetical protein
MMKKIYSNNENTKQRKNGSRERNHDEEGKTTSWQSWPYQDMASPKKLMWGIDRYLERSTRV